MHQNIVPVFHAGLDTGHAHRVRQQPRQPLAGILSGFVGIQTEEHTFHVRAFRKKLLQCLCRHAAQCQITVLLPVFREQLDEGQQVDGRFKDQQLFVGATMGKAKRLFCTGCILPKLFPNPTATCVAGMPVCIPPHKDHVVVGGVFVNISGGDEEVHQRGTEFPFLCQIVQDVGIGDVPQRQTKRQRGGGVSLRLDFARLSGQHLHRFGEGLAVKFHHKIHRKATLALAVPEPFVSADGQAVVGFPAVFLSAAHQRFALCPEKIFQIGGVCTVNLVLRVGHVPSSL